MGHSNNGEEYIDPLERDESDNDDGSVIYMFPDFFEDDLQLQNHYARMLSSFDEGIGEVLEAKLCELMVEESLRAALQGYVNEDGINQAVVDIGEWFSENNAEHIADELNPASEAKVQQEMYSCIERLITLIRRKVSGTLYIDDAGVSFIIDEPGAISVTRNADINGIVCYVELTAVDLDLPVAPTREEFIELMKSFQKEIGEYVGQAGIEPLSCANETVYIGRRPDSNHVVSPWANPYKMTNKNDTDERVSVTMEYYCDVISNLTNRDSKYHWKKVVELYNTDAICHCAKFTKEQNIDLFCHGHILVGIGTRIAEAAQNV